jgi:hypothetical protein
MTAQFGFDFGDTAPAFTEAPFGTWNDPEFTLTEHRALFAKASAGLERIAGPARPLFREGIEASSAQLAKMIEWSPREEDQSFGLWRADFKPDAGQFLAFVAHCSTMIGASFPGIEYKVRSVATMMTAAMFIQDVGTIIVRQWANDNIGIDYHPWRDHFFLESYRDTIQRHEVPYTVWGRAYCADKLAMSGKNVASVPTFAVNGREYINDGTTSRGSYCECEGWTFCAAEAWTGPTYNYTSQCKAWDEGRAERGDRRGLIVRVRGQLCVLDGASEFYDNNAQFLHFSSDDAEESNTDPDHDTDDSCDLDDEDEASAELIEELECEPA